MPSNSHLPRKIPSALDDVASICRNEAALLPLDAALLLNKCERSNPRATFSLSRKIDSYSELARHLFSCLGCKQYPGNSRFPSVCRVRSQEWAGQLPAGVSIHHHVRILFPPFCRLDLTFCRIINTYIHASATPAERWLLFLLRSRVLGELRLSASSARRTSSASAY